MKDLIFFDKNDPLIYQVYTKPKLFAIMAQISGTSLLKWCFEREIEDLDSITMKKDFYNIILKTNKEHSITISFRLSAEEPDYRLFEGTISDPNSGKLYSLTIAEEDIEKFITRLKETYWLNWE
jgi:hypothetical protein